MTTPSKGQAQHRLLQVRLLHPDSRLPNRVHVGDAGFDLFVSRRTVIDPGGFADVPHQIAIEPPWGSWSLIVARSSTFRQRRLMVLEGVIDTGFRGELFTGVFNTTTELAIIEVGDRLSQLLLFQHTLLQAPGVLEVDELSDSVRGERGFGSTGV